jgi:hypothetical protein
MAVIVEKRCRAQGKVDEAEREQREATASARAASEALTKLEHRALAGEEKIAAADRRGLEQALPHRTHLPWLWLASLSRGQT